MFPQQFIDGTQVDQNYLRQIAEYSRDAVMAADIFGDNHKEEFTKVMFARRYWVAALEPGDLVEIHFSKAVEDHIRMIILTKDGGLLRLLGVDDEDTPDNWVKACDLSGLTIPYNFKLMPVRSID